jgi:putative transposase
MEPSDLKQLRELEEENRRLKQMYAELNQDHNILKDIVEKKAVTAWERRPLAEYAIETHRASQRRAFRCVGLSRLVLDSTPHPREDGRWCSRSGPIRLGQPTS